MYNEGDIKQFGGLCNNISHQKQIVTRKSNIYHIKMINCLPHVQSSQVKLRCFTF